MASGKHAWILKQEWYPFLVYYCCGLEAKQDLTEDEKAPMKKKCIMVKKAVASGEQKFEWLVKQESCPFLVFYCLSEAMQDLTGLITLSQTTMKKKCKWVKEAIASRKKEWFVKQEWYPGFAAYCGLESRDVPAETDIPSIGGLKIKREPRAAQQFEFVSGLGF
ncbi:unnamed protein product [Polarella glacialis]|uniref:Uncharacterized protein n=1 Tax=Polarella glacialis TaxID=89957 RepID=A0A813G3M4_POLGL|nr:unnamed protein product [Polarella glacialis]